MSSNYHLLIVHFPIVFAILYGVMEIISFIWGHNLIRKQIIGWIALLGFISSIVAQQTGEMIKHANLWTTDQNKLIEIHSALSNVIVWIFGIALVSYAIEFVLANGTRVGLSAKVGVYLVRAKMFFGSKILRLLLGLSSIAVITAVGALGGAIAFGCDVDPVAKLLCSFI